MYNDETPILAQNAFPQIRRSRFNWLLVFFSLPLFGVIAAFGIVPKNTQDNIQVEKIIENVKVPNVALQSGDGVFWREEKIQRGDTIATVLARLQITNQNTVNFLRASKETRSLYQLRPGRSLRAQTTANGDLLSLWYINNNGNLLLVDKSGDSFIVSEKSAPTESRILMQSGEIKSSLFAATDAAHLSDNIAIQLAEIFSSDIDFYHDLRKGDRFTVIYEMLFNDGEPIKTGRVLGAEFINQGKKYQAVFFQPEGEKGDYYTPDGKNLRKTFLRSPLTFSRISSGFSAARFHPVLRTWRAHKGVDYAAPIGTPIKATADGIVSTIGKQNGYGNLIIVQHQGSYSTVYGHLSKFSPSLRRGSRVNQGDIIGYVGMTGLVTGPHLHYEFRINGAQRNPLKVALPTALPIEAKYATAFGLISSSTTQQLDLLRITNLAKLN